MTDTLIDHRSEAERLADAGLLDDFLASLDEAESEALLWDWTFWRRTNQALPDGDWDGWFIRAGRGYGKTRTGAESIRSLVSVSEQYGRVGLIAPTAGDGRDVMVEGESGILACHPPGRAPRYEPSKRRLTWPNGAVGTIYSGEEPDRLRGPQHDVVWIDEPASMAYGEEALDNARLGLRLGRHPRLIVTGTPRPRRWLRDWADEPGVISTTGSTYENQRNLAPAFIQVVLGKYEGTRLGRQELWAEWLDDVEGALWAMTAIERHRVATWRRDKPWASLNEYLTRRGDPVLVNQRRAWRTVVAVDPPAETAECGIVTATAPRKGRAGVDHCVVLADDSLKGRPEDWGARVVQTFYDQQAEAVWAEKNQGGDMVRATIHAVDPTVPVKSITAKVSKQARAEPVAALYERGWIHHLGTFVDLEEQQTTWIPDESKSPDRLDALVHAVRVLLDVDAPAPAKARSAVNRRI